MGGQQLAIVLSLLIPVPIAVMLLVHINKRRAPVDLPLALLVVAGGVWCGFYALELALDGYAAKRLAGKMEYIAFVLAPLGWFLLGMQLRGWLSRIDKRGFLLLSVMPVITLGMVFTSDFHDFFWRSKELVEFNGLRLFKNVYGPGFWIHATYSYALNLAGVILAFTSFVGSSGFYTRQRVAITIAMTVPWLTNIVYIFRLTDYTIDFSPFAIVGSSLILVLGVFRFRFGDLVPVARGRVIAEMRDAILILDDLMRVVDFNHALKELFPDKKNIMGTGLEKLLDAHPKLLSLLQRQQENADLMYTGFDDRVHRVSTEFIGANQGTPARLILLRDLTTDSRLQDSLRLVVESTAQDVGEDFYRSLTRSLALVLNTKFAMVAVTDPTDETRMNTLAFWDGDGHGRNFSYSIVGAPCENVIHRGTWIVADGVARQFPEDKALREMNVESYLGTPLFSHDGQPIGLLSVMDVKPMEYTEIGASVLEIFGIRAATEIERRHNEERIEASERGYRQIVETTRDGVCVVNEDGLIEFVNTPMASLLARDKESLVNSTFVELLSADPDISKQMASQENGNLEFSLVNHEGDEKWVVVSKTVIADSDETGTGMLYMFSDITEQHLLEEANKGIEEQLRHAQKLESLGVLAGGVAHDFNNLLMPVIGYIDLIRQRSSKDQVVTEYLHRIESAGEKLADLCNQMLTYSGKGHFEESVIDINELVTDMKDLVRVSVPNTVSLGYATEGELPCVKADATQISQVIMNLVINAGEASSRNRAGRIRVSTGLEYLDGASRDSLRTGDHLKPGDYVYFEVEDEGVGISSEDQERLFEPFFTTKFTGRGLGMAVVFGIVRAHKGAIEVDSVPGEGTRVRVFFPATTERKPEELSETDESEKYGLKDRGKVLVVDDEFFVREIFRGMLQAMGFDVVEAADGEEGLSTYNSNKLELVACVIDLTMPGMGGNELAVGIRKQDADVPIMLVSGYSQKEINPEVLSSSNVMFLQKPFTLSQFRSVMNSQLESAAGNRNVH
jgi:PAS domain S-box-containing protein